MGAAVAVVMDVVKDVVAPMAGISWILYTCLSTEELLPGNSWKNST